MNRKTLFAALACALLVFSMLGCGTTDKLQSIQLSTSNTVFATPGTLDLFGEGGTAQLYAWGNYSNGKQLLLGGSGLAYQIAITQGSLDQNGDPLPVPPLGVLMTPTALLTAVPALRLHVGKCGSAPSDHTGLCTERFVFGYGHVWGVYLSAGICCGRFAGGYRQYDQSDRRMRSTAERQLGILDFIDSARTAA